MVTSATPRVLMHIGLPKCGSTTIQRHFAAHAPRYRKMGVVYPKLLRDEAGYRSHRPFSTLAREDIPDAAARLWRRTRDARAVLLSTEAWGDALPGGQAPLVAQALAERFGAENVTLLAYFRAPLPFLESAYAQFLEGGLFFVPKPAFFAEPNPSLARFVRTTETLKGFAPYDLLAWTKMMDDAFPGITRLYRSIEPEDLEGCGLIDDVCRLLDVAPQPDTAPPRNRRRAQVISLAQQFAQAELPKTAWQKRRVLRGLTLSSAADWPDDLRHSTLCVGPDLAAEISDCLARDRAAIAARFSGPVTALTAAPDVAAIGPDRDLSPKEQAEVLAAFRNA